MPRSGVQTRAAIITAAERLFARDGVEGTSISAITREAGQRNNYAVGFHFGGKDELLDAVLEKHLARVETTRAPLLEEAERHQPDPVWVARALVEPLAERLTDPDGGPEYLRIQAELLSRRDPPGPTESSATVRRLYSVAAALLREADVDPADQSALVIAIVFHGLADHTRRRPDASAADIARFRDLLTHNVAALLTPTPPVL